jgi:hypothetical protein
MQGAPSGPPPVEMCMNRADAQGLVAYLRLFT